MTDNWFKIQTIYAITSSLQQYENVNDEDDEDDVLKRIRMSNMGMVDGYEVDTAYLNIVCDPIVGMLPCCLLPKNAKNKKYYTELILESGNVVFAVGKPEAIFEKLCEFMKAWMFTKSWTKFQSSPAHIPNNNYKSQIHFHWSYIAEGIGDIPLYLSAMHILHTLLFAFSSCAMMNLCLDSFDLSWFLFIFFSNAIGMRSATIDDVVWLYFFFIFAKVLLIFDNN